MFPPQKKLVSQKPFSVLSTFFFVVIRGGGGGMSIGGGGGGGGGRGARPETGGAERDSETPENNISHRRK